MQKTKHTGIYRLEDGRLRIRVYAKDPVTGRMRDKQRTLPAGTSLAEAEDARDAIATQLQQQHAPEVPTRLDVVGDYAVHWFELRAETWTSSTRTLNHRIVNHFILGSPLEEVPIMELSRADVQRWVAWADQLTKVNSDEPYSKATRHSWWAVLKQVLLDLRADMRLLHNPVDRVKPPQADGGNTRERQTLNVAELVRLVEFTRTQRPARYAEVLILATTGMRAGELYGLKWHDIDEDAGKIHIRRSAPKGNLQDTTKTKRSRTAVLTPRAAMVLREHRKEMMREDHPGLASGLVFPSDVGTPRYSSGIRKTLAWMSEELELDVVVTPQVIRRTFNTLSVAGGIDGIITRALMGHSSEQMTEHYAGVTDDEKKAAVERILGDLF